MTRFEGRIWRALGAALLFFGLSTAVHAETVSMPVPVAVIYPGQPIEPSALSDEEFVVNAENAAFYALSDQQLSGKVAVHTLLPGKPVPLSAVRQPYLVQRGVPTRIVFASGGLTIQAVGTALEAGGPGDFIRVRNVDSGQIVSGTIQSDGTVRVGFR